MKILNIVDTSLLPLRGAFIPPPHNPTSVSIIYNINSLRGWASERGRGRENRSWGKLERVCGRERKI